MKVTLFNDCDNNYMTYAVVISEVTTSSQIRKITTRIKNKYPGEWTFEDIKDALPDDCIVFEKPKSVEF